MKKTVGVFETDIGSPYPCWCSVKTNGREIRFNHKDIPDLLHAIKEMKRHALLVLPKEDKAECI